MRPQDVGESNSGGMVVVPIVSIGYEAFSEGWTHYWEAIADRWPKRL